MMSRNIAAHVKGETLRKTKYMPMRESVDLTQIFRENIHSINWFIYLLTKGIVAQLKTYFISKQNLKELFATKK